MITRLTIAFEDFLGSSIASQVMPPCTQLKRLQTDVNPVYQVDDNPEHAETYDYMGQHISPIKFSKIFLLIAKEKK